MQQILFINSHHTQLPIAYIRVYCFAVSIACALLLFHTLATSLARGSSGLGSLKGFYAQNKNLENEHKNIKPQESLNTQENSADLKSWRPAILQNIQTNSTKLVDIGMVQLCQETNLFINSEPTRVETYNIIIVEDMPWVEPWGNPQEGKAPV